MRKLSVPALALALLSLTGCGSGHVYDINYVRAAAVDGAVGKAAVFAFYDDNAEPFASVGDDLNDVLRETEIGMGKTVFTGHTELIVLGDCDYVNTLSFMLNEWKVSPSCLVVYGGSYAAYVLKNFDAETLADSISHAVSQGEAPECDIVTVLSGLLSDNRAAEVASVGRYGFSGTTVLEEK